MWFFLKNCFISLPKKKYPQKISICSKILSLYYKAKTFYTPKFPFDESQVIGGLLKYMEEMIKSANKFYINKYNKPID